MLNVQRVPRSEVATHCLPVPLRGVADDCQGSGLVWLLLLFSSPLGPAGITRPMHSVMRTHNPEKLCTSRNTRSKGQVAASDVRRDHERSADGGNHGS